MAIVYRTQDSHHLQPDRPKISLLDSLLALLGVEVSRDAQAPIVLGHEGADDAVLARAGYMLVVALGGPRAGIEFWPVDLQLSASSERAESRQRRGQAGGETR